MIYNKEYWIPDFVLVRETYDDIAETDILETIIVDAKLSRHTDWTKNQKAAMGMSGWDIRSISNNVLLNGPEIDDLDRGTFISVVGEFKKVFTEGGAIKVE